MGKDDKVQKEKQPSGNPAKETNGASQPTNADAGIHQWFATLQIEERARALGFQDGTMLSILLKRALLASSSLESIAESRTDKIDSINGLRRFEWHSGVSMSDFEASIPTATNSDETESIDRDATKASAAGTAANKVEPHSESKDSLATMENESTLDKDNESRAMQLPDAYRIRVIEEKSPLSSQENGDAAANSSSNPSHSISSNELETKITAMMNNICVIFAATNKLNISDVAKHAYITLQPSSLRVQDGVDTLSVLEEILIHALPKHAHFESPQELSWESLRKSVFDSAEHEKISIPLYAVFVLRMKSAIIESYRQSTTAESNDKSDATILEIANTGNSAIKTGGVQLASSFPVFQCLVQLSSLPKTEQALLLEFSDASPSAGNRKGLSNEGEGLVIPFHVLLQEVHISVLTNLALSTSDAVRSIVKKFIQGETQHKQSSSPATRPSKQDSNSNDSPNVPSSQEAETIPEPAKANEQVSKPTGGGKRKKRKKKVSFFIQFLFFAAFVNTYVCYQKRKGNSGQSQNSVAKLQSPMTQQQEAVAEPAQDEQISKKDDTPVSDSLKVEDVKEDGEQKNMQRDQLASNAPTIDKTISTSVEPDTVENALPESQLTNGCKKVSMEGGSDSKDDEKTEPLDKDETEKPAEEASKTLNQNIIAGLSTIADIENDDSGEWETVEVKGRGNRKKAAERAHQHRFQSHQHGQSHSGQNGTSSKKSKSSRNSNRKQRANMRKMVREILSTVLDRVEEDVQKRRQACRETSSFAVTKWGSTGPPLRGKGTMNESRDKSSSRTTIQSKSMSVRDLTVSRQEDSAKKGGRSPVRSAASRLRQRDGRSGQGQIRRGADGSIYREKKNVPGTGAADQNTAPTVQETLSAVSMEASARQVPVAGAEVVRGDVSSRDSGEGSKARLSQTRKEVSPPLPTLLSPENANSANSSVASSLDTSHAGHQNNNIASQQGKEKDVGYHLLDVCDRLTRDINIFMKRREHALGPRRRERGAVLMALQGTVSVSCLCVAFVDNVLKYSNMM
ncbi:MAG: hypothetical protein SGBAC_007919 [Bacillariaceae sp.]